MAVGSAPLFDEYERKVREVGSKLDPAVRAEDASRYRRQVEAVCVAGSSPFDPATSPALTKDPTDDPIVLTALLADADLLISDDRHIVPDGERQIYSYEEHTTCAVTFNTLMAEYLGPLDIDWSAIAGGWLAHAYRRPD